MSISYLFPPPYRVPDQGDRVNSRPDSAEHSRNRKRNTKAVGDLSEAMVIAALIRHGYLVSIPFGEIIVTTSWLTTGFGYFVFR